MRSPVSSASAPVSPSSGAASISSASSRIFCSTARGSFQSKPTLEALRCNSIARASAGCPALTLDNSEAFGFFLGLDALPRALDAGRRQLPVLVGKDVRMPPDHLGSDGLNHIAEREGVPFSAHGAVK